MKVPLLDLKKQYSSLRPAVRAALNEVCDSQVFIGGPRLEAFERNIARYCGVPHAVGVSSGTDSLLAALMALGVGPGDAVLTTPYSFFATAGSIARLGATPVFADIDPDTYNIDPRHCRAILENPPPRLRRLHVKALMPVHLFGQCAEMAPLLALAREHGLAVVEDAAQAIGATYRLDGRTVRAGAMGRAGCFSFFPSKNLGGFGDGGMIVTRDAGLAEKLRRLRNHGAHPRYCHHSLGGNFRLDALQAAVLDIKLPYLEKWHAARRRNAARYSRLLRKSGAGLPAAAYRRTRMRNHHIYNQYVIRVPDRDLVVDKLREAGVDSAVYYPIPLHLQPCFEYLGYRAGDFPESERAAGETLALPVYPELTESMQKHVAATIRAALGQEG